jgi:hypothetical protein
MEDVHSHKSDKVAGNEPDEPVGGLSPNARFRAFAKRLVNVTADEIKIREAFQSTKRDKPPLPNE